MALTTVPAGLLASGAALGNITPGSITPPYLATQSQYTGFKNRIINGAMMISQRGTTFSSTGYTLDRWNLTQATTPTVTQSTDAPAGFKNSISVSGGNYLFLCQRIESNNVTDLSGQTVTVSFWAKQTSGTLSPFVAALDYATATDNFTSTTNISTPNVGTLTASWTYYTLTYTNLPAGVLNGLQLRFYIANGGTTTYLVTGVQLEVGTVATSFDARDYGRELIMCQRYYEKSCEYSVVPGATAVGFLYDTPGIYGRNFAPFSVTKRATPTGVVYSGLNGATNNINVGGSNYAVTVGTTATIINWAATSTVPAQFVTGYWTASAEL